MINSISKIIQNPILGCAKVFHDERGLSIDFGDINKKFHSYTNETIKHAFYSFSGNEGTARGLHYQRSPEQQWKMILILSGSIIDYSCCLSEEDNKISSLKKFQMKIGQWIIIPKNFLHGFITIEKNTNVMYLMSNYFVKSHYSIYSLRDAFQEFNLPEINLISEQDKNGIKFK